VIWLTTRSEVCRSPALSRRDLEIVDHHRLGGVETMEPLLAVIAPVGSTATLVLRRYHQLGLVPPREIAGLMVARVLSDTMLLKSPTTTPEDVAAVEHLGKVLGENPLAFGVRMYDPSSTSLPSAGDMRPTT